MARRRCTSGAPPREVNTGSEIRAMLFVDPWHWMSEDEWFPDDNPTLRKNQLRVARLIEYGAELEPREMRLTLVECTKRPNRKPCTGFMVVVKEPEGTIYAECMTCKKDQVVISNWETTPWATGICRGGIRSIGKDP